MSKPLVFRSVSARATGHKLDLDLALALGRALVRLSPVLLLASCGGGSIESTVPTVNTITILGTPSYGQNTQVVVTGTALDQGISVQSSACNRNATLLTTAPTASDARTAYFQIPCAEVAVGTVTAGVFRDSSGLSLGTTTYNVATPVTSIAVVGTPLYGQSLQLVVNGTFLDDGVRVQSAGCQSLTRAPITDRTRATFQCAVATVGSFTANALVGASTTPSASTTFSVPTPQVTMTVGNGSNSLGSFVITLDPARAPITVNNFLSYVNTRWYEGVVFHRNSPGFVLQGGGFNSGLNPASAVPAVKTPNANIVLEDNAGLLNLQWTVAMARTNAPDTANSQFFINLVNNPFLDRSTTARGYAVFGNVTAGTGVITTLTAAPCVAYPALVGSGECLPFPNLVITSATQTR